MVTVVVFEFSGMRCQPLRRALAFYLAISAKGLQVIPTFFYVVWLYV
ncbi:acetyltransferase [Vibrio cholerae]|nr:acetyltransferase [Vibrio cholerae]TYW48449.1 acetyltransferase [Vibrio cholerae]